jgi:hypothetical protein
MEGPGPSKRRDVYAGVDGRPSQSSTRQPQQRKAVPPGYLHDLLHSRHLMKTVGLRKQAKDRNMIPNPLVGVPVKPKSAHGPHASRRAAKAVTPQLPELFQQRKLFLDRRKDRKNRERQNDRTKTGGKPTTTGARQERRLEQRQDTAAGESDDTINLLSLPEELLLKIVCHLTHEEAKPLFLVCKELSATLKNAIKFHFNFATPTAMAVPDGGLILDTNQKHLMPLGRRPQKRRAVTAYMDVMAHLRKGQRNVIEKEAPTTSTQSAAAPRALMFNTPQTTPTSLQPLPAVSVDGLGGTPVNRRQNGDRR